MMLTRIGHGDLTAVARNDIFLVMRPLPGRPDIDKELGVHLWHALSSERGVSKAVSILAQAGLEDMPEFALVHPEGNGLRVIVRGSFNVLILNHDGRYSSVDVQEASTWREHQDLPASEWCIRDTPGRTLEDSETSYMASGVSKISIMASLGWDDPDSPENTVEAVETGAIAAVELKQSAQLYEAAQASRHHAQSPPAQEQSSAQSPEANSAPSAPGPSLYSAPTEVLEPVPAHQPVLNAIAAPLNAKEVMQPPVPPHSEKALAQAYAEHDVAVPPVPPATGRILKPLGREDADVSNPSDDHNTVLTNNLQEMRQSMENNTEVPLPLEPITATMNLRVPMIKLSNGVRIPLDRTVLIGRAPEASRVPLKEMPRLVNVASPNNDVSRTHAQIRVEGEFVLVTDLNSTNGVFVSEPGRAPRRLHPDEPTQLEPGMIVDLGDGATFELEALQ